MPLVAGRFVIFRPYLKYGRKIINSNGACWPNPFTFNDDGRFRSRLGRTLKFSSEHVECSFDNRADNFLPKVRKSFAQSPEKRKKNTEL